MKSIPNVTKHEDSTRVSTCKSSSLTVCNTTAESQIKKSGFKITDQYKKISETRNLIQDVEEISASNYESSIQPIEPQNGSSNSQINVSDDDSCFSLNEEMVVTDLAPKNGKFQ